MDEPTVQELFSNTGPNPESTSATEAACTTSPGDRVTTADGSVHTGDSLVLLEALLCSFESVAEPLASPTVPSDSAEKEDLRIKKTDPFTRFLSTLDMELVREIMGCADEVFAAEDTSAESPELPCEPPIQSMEEHDEAAQVLLNMMMVSMQCSQSVQV